MKSSRKPAWFYLAISFLLLQVMNLSSAMSAQVEPYIKSVEQAEKGMSLWQLLTSGGFIMIVIALLSVATLSLIVYFFLALKPKELVPLDFGQDVISKLSTRKYAVARELCAENDNLISRIVLAGLDRSDKGPAAAREAAEISAKTEVSKLWESLSYLSDIAAVSPLVGLLGTVLGMIQAFNTIAFQSAAVKPILLAGGVSKAMVTTAGGLTVAIPAMLFYAFFRSRILRISVAVESLTTEILEVFADSDKKR